MIKYIIRNSINILIILIISLNFVQGQVEVSKKIEYKQEIEKQFDNGAEIVPYENDYILQSFYFAEYDHLSQYHKLHGMVARVDNLGDTVWTRKLSIDDHFYIEGGRSSIHLEDDYFISGFVAGDDLGRLPGFPGPILTKQIYIYKIDYSGNVIDSSSFDLDGERVKLNGIVQKDGLFTILCSSISGKSGHQILQLDTDLNVVRDTFITYRNFYYAINHSIKVTSQNKFLLSFQGARFDSLRYSIQILDDDFSVENEFVGFPNKYMQGGFYSHALPLDNGEIIGIWNEDISAEKSYSPDLRIFKFDENLNLKWSKLHKFDNRFYVSQVRKYQDDIFVVGLSQYFLDIDSVHGPYFYNSCLAHLDINGDLVKTVEVYDERKDRENYSKDVAWNRNNQQIAMIGNIYYQSTVDPFGQEQDTYFLTLDEDLCWNGNCNPVIFITGDTTSYSPTTSVKEPSLNKKDDISKIYPNPSNGSLTIESKGRKLSHLEVIDMQGKVIMESDIMAPKTSVNLHGYSSGVYLLKVYSVDKKVVETHKIIVNR